MLITGLNPYGLTYYLGLQGQGTPRANPNGRGLDGFLEVAAELRARSLEMHALWFAGFSEANYGRVRERLHALSMIPVISLGPPLEHVDVALSAARALGARVVRLGLTPVLCGDRAAHGEQWPRMLAHASATLKEYAPRAADLGIALAIENHQDLGSQELLDLAGEAGANVGIAFDTGNPLAVGEDILGFARRVAPMVRHLHLKDYRIQWTELGYRMVRCAIGDGCVPFAAIARMLEPLCPSLTASLEPAALEARHIRLFTPEWWHGYPPRTAAELGLCLADARRALLPDSADYRTPWERQDPPELLIQYELEMIQRSAANMRALGLMQ